MKRICFFIFIPILSACSVWQSDGRKFLEANASRDPWCDATCPGIQSNLISCGSADSTTAWVAFEKNERAELWISDGDTFELKVTPSEETETSCYFRFSTAQELYEKSAAATDYTLHLSPAL